MGTVLCEELRKHSDCVLAGGVVERADDCCHHTSAASCSCAGTFGGQDSHEPVLSNNINDIAAKSDVIVDFSTKTSTPNVISTAEALEKPLVCGVTGLTLETHELMRNAAKNIPIFYSENFSVGISAVGEILERLAVALRDFDVEISEMHHSKKKDAPSGTALKFGRIIASAREQPESVFCLARSGDIGERPAEQIGFSVVRGGGVYGTHTIHFLGKDETVSITHQGMSRSVFAEGAIRAARVLIGAQPGLYKNIRELSHKKFVG